MWPTFFKKSITTGDMESNIGICTLWSKKKIFADKLAKDKYCIIGNLYTADGINYLLKNILAHPVIDCLIVCGKDFFKSGDALINFFEKGIDENRKVIDSDAYLHSNIPAGAIEALRKNIKIIDLREKEEELVKVLEKFSSKGKYFIDPIILPDQTKKQEFLTTKIIGFRVEGDLPKAWLKILDLTMKFGEVKESEHELKQKEVLDILSVIKGFSLKPFLGLKERDINSYIDLFFSNKTSKEVEYTYGKRLFRFAFEYPSKQFAVELRFFVNQIDKVVRKLKKSPHSRRVVASLWNPFQDLESKNPPCLTQITWNVKNKTLYQTCIFRSHDLFGAYLLNVLALRRLQEKTADEIGVKPGDLIILSQSAHIYENSWKRVKDILRTNYRDREIAFEGDKVGYFRIEIDKEKQEIFVQHYLTDGHKSKFEFRGKNVVSIYKKILNENLVFKLDHAAYLGRELTKAEECLKNKKEYIQD